MSVVPQAGVLGSAARTIVARISGRLFSWGSQEEAVVTSEST